MNIGHGYNLGINLALIDINNVPQKTCFYSVLRNLKLRNSKSTCKLNDLIDKKDL